MSEYLVVIDNGETTKLRIVPNGTKVLGNIRFWELTPKRDVRLNRALKSWTSSYIFGNLRVDGALYGQPFEFMCACVEEIFGNDDATAAREKQKASAFAAGKSVAEAVPVVLGTMHLVLKLVFMPFKIIVWVLILTGLIKRH